MPHAQADPAGYGGPPGTQVRGEGGKGTVVSRGADHETLKVSRDLGSIRRQLLMTLAKYHATRAFTVLSRDADHGTL